MSSIHHHLAPSSSSSSNHTLSLPPTNTTTTIITSHTTSSTPLTSNLTSSQPSSPPPASPVTTTHSSSTHTGSPSVLLDQIPPSIAPKADSDLHSRIAELGDQLTQLNLKLVRSFERISNLEDELHESHAKNEKLAARNQTLELESAQHEEALKGGLLVERANVQSELQRLTQRVIQESERRSKSEASLSSINQELDDLSASLFSEANRLVATEKLQRIKAERKVAQVEEAMKRVEEVIEARRDQSNQLRLSLETAERERDQYRIESEFLRNQLNQHLSDSSTRSSNPTSSQDSLTKSLSIGSIESPLPSHLIPSSRDTVYSQSNPCSPMPLHHSLALNLLPVPQLKLSQGILPYTEFFEFIHYLRRTREDALTRPTQPSSLTDSYYSAAVAMSSIAIVGNPSLQLTSPSTKEQTLAQTPKELLSPLLPLSQHLSQPFVKRCLDEDSEPTLRLDIAPGLNFISRRAILTALLEGNLVIEPVWSESDQVSEFEKCTLCGCSLDPWISSGRTSSIASSTNHSTHNNLTSSSASAAVRKMLRGGGWGFGTITKAKRSSAPTPSSQNVEKVGPNLKLPSSGRSTPNADETQPLHVHMFKATDGASTRYPICPTYCLARLRSACDLWTFVRSLQRGVLLDESFWFTRYISSTSANTASTDTHSLGLAYDHALQSIRGQRSSIDSLNESVSLTHSIPSSVFPSAPTCRSHGDDSPSGGFIGQPDQRRTSLPAADERSEEHQRTSDAVISDSDELDARSRSIHNLFPARALPSSPSPSPTSTTDHEMRHEITSLESAGNTSVPVKRSSFPGQVPILSPAPPPIPRRSPARSLSQPFNLLSPLISKSLSATNPIPSSVNRPSVQVKDSLSQETEKANETFNRSKLNSTRDGTSTGMGLARSCSVTPEYRQRPRGESRDKSQSSSIESMETGWEEKCWYQVIKLKEEMFLKRVGMTVLSN